MKKTLRFWTLCVALVCALSLFASAAFADGLVSGKEMFADVSEDELETMGEYEKLMYRAYEFDGELLLPNKGDVYASEDVQEKCIQGKYGMARGQHLYSGPDAEAEAEWTARDGCRVKVYAEYQGFCFVELLFLDRSEGTFAWVPAEYVVDQWSIQLSYHRSMVYGGWVF